MTDETHNLIYTSIPYDEGWNVTVDGEPVEITTVCGALLAVDASLLPEGAHTVVLTYMPKCYVIGLAISVGGMLLLALCLAIRFLSHKIKERNFAIKYESVAPNMPEDDDTACIPLAELLAEVEAERAAADTSEISPEDAVTDAAENGEIEMTPEEADAVLRDLFPEEEFDGDEAETQTES